MAQFDALEVVFTDPSHIRQETVIVRGRYRIVPFSNGNHQFRGIISVGEYSETHTYSLILDLSQPTFVDDFRIALIRHRSNGVRPTYNNFGMLYVSRPFFRRQWLIIVGDGNFAGSLTDSPVIVPNANDREDAMRTMLWFMLYRP